MTQSKMVYKSLVILIVLWMAQAGCSDDSAQNQTTPLDNLSVNTCDCETGNHCTASELTECKNEPKPCPDECPDDCTNGVCNSHEKQCPSECLDDCTNGVCNSHEMLCPDECPDDCTNGVCNPHEKQCPDECPDDCTNGVCNSHEKHCPPECPEQCDENGQCPVGCPVECTTSCDEAGMCMCSPDCKNGCHEDGTCLCPSSCPNGCNINGECECETDSECPVMCGSEIVKSVFFSYKELDLLTPDSYGGRNEDKMVVYIKTDKATYNIESAPCADDIELSIEDPTIAVVSRSAKYAVFDAKNVGTTTCTAKFKGRTSVAGTITIRVLDPDNLNDDLTAKNGESFVHQLNGPLKMKNNFVSQGFDLYYNESDDKTFTTYFTDLEGVKINKIVYKFVRMNVFKTNVGCNENCTPMIFYGAGHGQNLCVENTSKDDYLWFSNYGTLTENKDKDNGNKYSTNGCTDSQIISRVKWEDNWDKNKIIYPSDSKENYYYKDDSCKDGYYAFESALDTTNNKFAFKATCATDNRIYFRIYHLDKIRALEDSEETLLRPITWINKDKVIETVEHPKVTAKNLSKLEPAQKFSKARIVNKGYAYQGFDIDNGILYVVAGTPDCADDSSPCSNYKSKLRLYLYKYNGTSIGGKNAEPQDNINQDETIYAYKLLDPDDKELNTLMKKLDAMVNYTENGIVYKHIGYFEPEGIKVSDGKLYLSMTVVFRKDGDTTNIWRQFLFVYDLLAQKE